MTTLAVGLAALWPRPGAVLVEGDPAGGDLWARFGHHPSPGLAGLAAATVHPAAGQDLRAHLQRLPVGVDAVLAPPGDGAAASVRMLADRGTGILRRAAGSSTVVLDLGRLEPGGPNLALAGAADQVLLLARPELAELNQVGARLPWLLPRLAGRLWLVPAGSGRVPTGQITRALGVSVIGAVPHSRWGAPALAGQLQVPNWRRLAWGRAVARIAEALAATEPAPALGTPLLPPAVSPVLHAPQPHAEPVRAPR
ncbi:MinD/ParA family ATP-binding protein [Phytohabitans rumicis]|uniref:MinD/ParA family ATP-binding protein n=1 Tax=Phytohabitans rumicis TaxID=1076125 RepID=UPI001C49AF61|nr:hypothetical protein [Phytohabitans rumicis]